VNKEPSGGICRIEEAASDEGSDEFAGVARPLEGRRNLLVVVQTDLASRCVLRGEPPEEAGEAEGVRPWHAEHDGKPPDLRTGEGTV
jgi:hypothetical protein